MSDVLRIFEQNDTEKLYSIALKLFNKGIFNYYLSYQQLQVLEQIFKHTKDPKTYFKAFLESKVYLKFVEPPKQPVESSQNEQKPPIKSETSTPLIEHPEISQPSNDSQSSNDKEDKNKTKDDENFNNDEILIEQTIPNGVESARSLALKVRYILYDKAVLYYYNNDLDDNADYEIFEIDEDQPNQNPSESVNNPVETREQKNDDNYDDDDYDEDEEEEEKPQDSEKPDKQQNQQSEDDKTTDQEYDSDGNIIIEVPIIQSDSNQFDPKNLVENFNNIYHNFENDKETLIKRRKLEENDKLLEENDQSNISDLISMNLGAANLSLKHLLRSIDENKERLNLQDNELRQLIMDVRKNRSKWASDDKIGQEELYEACEKVVMELRSYTEHSTAFLNKVSKREAPNYLQVIKKPMDLNTILKKLKGFQYKSKTEFVDDVMLIWRNCLTYNSDPGHFLRGHAIAMQKKAINLIPLIPDITVRDRSEVEAEVEAEAENDPHTPASGKTTSKKGKKRARNGSTIKQETNVNTSIPDGEIQASTPTSGIHGSSTGATELPQPNGNSTNTSVTAAIATAVGTPAAGTPNHANDSILKGVGETTELLEDDDAGESNDYLNTEDNDKDDLEMTTWKNLTSKLRADLCIKRSELFRDNQLNKDTEAILSGTKLLKDFEHKKSQEKKTSTVFKPLHKIDEDPYLIEYDVSGVIPPLDYKGLDEEEIESNEAKLVDEVLGQGGFQNLSEFAPENGGLNKVANDNIKEMQEIRKLCFKISLIRQMQQQQFLHHSQLKPPEIIEIDDTIDIDPISRLENHDKMNKDLVYSVLKKRVSKISMLCGFESTEYFAIDTLTQVTSDYMDNLIKTIKTHIETPSVNKENKKKNTLNLSLLQNGIRKPDDLYIYVHENVLRQSTKLKDLRSKLSNFLKALLRPAIDLSNEKAFDDNSEQFVSGDFSNEIGDDFFGFKELGLDKEFGMIGNSIPLHLLHSRFTEANQVDDVQHSIREEFEKAPFKRLKDEEIIKEIGLFQPFLTNVVLEKTKLFNSKQFKTKREIQDYLANATNITLMDDEDYPKKQQKQKLPPNGKIPITKKKITLHTFFLPEENNQIKKETFIKQENGFNNINNVNNNVNNNNNNKVVVQDYDEDDDMDEPLSSQLSMIQEN